MQGAVDKSKERAKKYPNSYIPMQFENQDNPRAHKQTADEIRSAVNGKEVVVVAGIGTGGTACGIKKYLDEAIVYGVEPKESPLFTEGIAGAHKIQGIGANFKPEICKNNNLDGIIAITGDEAIKEARELAKKHGVFCGISAGANLAASKILSLKYPERLIVTIIPDGGDRYLSVW